MARAVTRRRFVGGLAAAGGVGIAGTCLASSDASYHRLLEEQVRPLANDPDAAFVNQAVEVPDARRELRSLLGTGALRPSLLLRFGFGPPMPRTLRRSVQDVLLTS